MADISGYGQSFHCGQITKVSTFFSNPFLTGINLAGSGVYNQLCLNRKS